MTFSFIKDKPYPFTPGKYITGGGDILKAIFETPGQGQNAEVYFSFGVMNSNTPQQINSWRVNLNVYNCDYGGVTTSIEKLPFQGKLRARMSGICTINDYANMDGELLSPISTWQMRLHSKTLLENSESLSPNSQDSTQYYDGGCVAYDIIVQPDQTNLAPNELSDVFAQPMGLINTGVLTSDALGSTVFTDTLNQYSVKFGGNLTVKFSGSTSFIWWEGNFANVNTWNFTPRLVVQRLVAGVLTIISVTNGTTQVLGSSFPGFAFPFNIATSGHANLLPMLTTSLARNNTCYIPEIDWNETFSNITVEANDNVYVELFIFNTLNGGGPTVGTDHGLQIQLTNYLNDIKYSQFTYAPATTADGYRVFDFLSSLLENTTGQPNALISKYFSPNGPGYKFMLTNGYAIRNYGANIYQPKMDIQSCLNSLQAIFCLYVGIRKLNNIEYLVVESVNDAFNNNVIATFANTSDWMDNNNAAVCYNKVRLGYNKYEGLNLIQ